MPTSPIPRSDGVLTFQILSRGQPLPDTVELLNLAVHSAVNSVPWARLVLRDGDMPQQGFEVADSAWFVPGAEIEIRLGMDGEASRVFQGEVVKLGLRVVDASGGRLEVVCRDKAHRMARVCHSASFDPQPDSELIRRLAATHGLACEVGATRVAPAARVQQRCSDWAFMLARAAANGLLVTVADGVVSVQPPALGVAPLLEVCWGLDLMAFEGEIDATTQRAAVTAGAWDPAAQAMLEQLGWQPDPLPSGNLSGAALAEAASAGTLPWRTSAARADSELQAWADAQRVWAELARCRGRVKFQGSALAKPATLLALKGLGERFNGSVFVGAVRHELSEGQWTSEVEFGLPEGATTEQGPSSLASPGLEIGVVTRLDADPAGERRVQVRVPRLNDAGALLWARLAQLQASDGSGLFFVPEVGDEVVLGCLDGDLAHPVVLGSLYSSARGPAYELGAENRIKAIVTRCKSRIEFDEQRRSITLSTPGGHRLLLSDEGGSVVLTDAQGSRVELGAGGLTLSSPRDVQIHAQGDIRLAATGQVQLSAQGDVSSEGLNVRCQAKVAFTGQGQASAELSAAGQTIVRGAMVMIN